MTVGSSARYETILRLGSRAPVLGSLAQKSMQYSTTTSFVAGS